MRIDALDGITRESIPASRTCDHVFATLEAVVVVVEEGAQLQLPGVGDPTYFNTVPSIESTLLGFEFGITISIHLDGPVVPGIFFNGDGRIYLDRIHGDIHHHLAAHGGPHQIRDQRSFQCLQSTLPGFRVGRSGHQGVSRRKVHAFERSQPNQVEGDFIPACARALACQQHVYIGDFSIAHVIHVWDFLPDERFITPIAVQEEGKSSWALGVHILRLGRVHGCECYQNKQAGNGGKQRITTENTVAQIKSNHGGSG